MLLCVTLLLSNVLMMQGKLLHRRLLILRENRLNSGQVDDISMECFGSNQTLLSGDSEVGE